MNRRKSLIAAIVTLLVPFRLHGGTIPLSEPQWGTVPLALPKWCEKVMTWARTCLRRGGHWTFEGIDWFNCSLGFMRGHLMNVHGHTRAEADSMDTNALVAVHDAHHEGRNYKQYSIPATPANGVNRMFSSSCPNGNCPTVPRRRGVFSRIFGD